MQSIDRSTWRWWSALRGAAVLNVGLLATTAVVVPLDSPMRRAQFVCATIYVAVCAFRSFYPRVDLERIVLVDHPLSSIVLGRSAATVAELAFTVQCALLVARLAPSIGVGWGWVLPWLPVPLIVVAQVCCWLGVLTLQHVWHAAEEAAWAVMMAGLALVFVAGWPASEGGLRVALPLGILGCAGAVFVMAGLDIPMYLRRWRATTAAGGPFLGVGDGFRDARSRRVPIGDWAVWRREVAWMTPYFTAGVW